MTHLPRTRITMHLTLALAIAAGLLAPALAAPRSESERAAAFTDEQRGYWAFQPVHRPQPPALRDGGWVRTAIDAFILARLEEAGLRPSPEADRVTLIRRATFDLHGLPPTPDEIDAFVNDESSDAWEKLIDRLLESPRYGQRMARLWLDLTRYADSDGYKADEFRPHIWRYRDYVVDSFNADKPYDRFVAEQLAGDEISPAGPEALIATGYLRLWPYEFNQRDVELQWRHILNDMTDNFGQVFIGMSVGCARCHDHKFDAILQDDYYRLQAFLAPIMPDDSLTAATPAQHREYDRRMGEYEQAAGEVLAQIEQIIAPHRQKVEYEAYEKYVDELRALLDADPSQLSPREKQIEHIARLQLIFEHLKIDARIKGDEKKKLDELRAQLEQHKDLKPDALTPVMAVRDVAAQPPRVWIDGDPQKEDVEPGVLSILDPADAKAPEVPDGVESTGRRLALARWVTSPDNPLTSRVIVNRLWQLHFGRGIVATANDFGTQGADPTHPQLLDWLAGELVDGGWRLKRMQKIMMMSAAYRQASVVVQGQGQRATGQGDGEGANGQSLGPRPSAPGPSVDPENTLLWRMRVRRVESDQLRDALLLASGELDDRVGGPAVDDNSTRRSLYVKQLRNNRPELLAAFDGPDMHNSCARRNETTTAPQALMLINGQWTFERAQRFAARLAREADESSTATVDRAYRIAFGRPPSNEERTDAIHFIDASSSPPSSEGPGEGEKPVIEPALEGIEAADINLTKGHTLSTPDHGDFAFDEFTVEARFYLRSIAADAAVRVIAAQWDGDTKHPGWSLGVTSTKSRHDPRNLILQLVGKTADGDERYEVVESNLRPRLHRLYHAIVSVKLSDTGKTGVTFHLRDLSAGEDSEWQTAEAAHAVASGIDNDVPLTIGTRHGQQHQGWDGMLDEVRLFNKAMPRGAVTGATVGEKAEGRSAREAIIGEWMFRGGDAFTRDSSGRDHHLTNQGVRPWTVAAALERREHRLAEQAIIDFCHVLLNANEFLYVD